MKKGEGLSVKPQSLQARMILSMVALLLLVCVLLMAALTWTQFFQRIDQQSIDSFYTKSMQKVAEVNIKMADIVENVVISSVGITQSFTTETAMFQEEIGTADLGSSLYLQARVKTTETLLSLLDNTMIDGAFYILFEESEHGYTGVHVRNLHPTRMSKTRDAYELVVGSTSISQTYQLSINANWDLYYNFPEEYDYDFLRNPVEAMEADPFGDLESYGYWDVPDSEEDASFIYYTLPLLDKWGQPYGLIGIEISNDFFREEYLSVADFSYQDSVHFLGRVEDGVLAMSEFTPHVSAVNSYLYDGLVLDGANVPNYPLFSTWTESTGELLCTVHTLNMYSDNSTFSDETWDFLTFVPTSEPYQYSEEIIDIFISSFVTVMILGLVGTIVFIRFSTRKIVGLSAYVSNLNPHQEIVFEKTNLKEIDDLTAAVKMLNQKVIDSSNTLDRIIKLTSLSLGGYEVLPQDGMVVMTEYIRTLLCLPVDEKVSLEEWEDYYKQLTQQPAMDVENTYFYSANGKKVWLRIISSAQEQGFIGMVMDVTREMEEAIEVKNQLDYDALTQLYSRNAFQRESNRLIEGDPDMKGAMLFIDLDNLKYTNDTFGHEAGDTLIKSASHIFDQFSVYGGVAARFSGDEFGIFIHGYESYEKILRIVREKFNQFRNATIKVPDGSEQRIRFSTGIAWYPKDAKDVPQLVKLADFAMYQAKHNAKGSMREFDVKVYEETAYIMENREAINKLIEEGLVKFKFQPIVDMVTGEIFAFEALMRSQLEAFKSPLAILNVAKAQSKSRELEKMLIQKTIAHAYEKREVIGARKIFINSITSQSMTREEFQVLHDKYGDFLKNIVIEIQEAEDDTPETRNEKVESVRSCGMQLAIDDFSGGFANELSLVSINPNMLKMDMSLGQGIAKDEDKRDLLKGYIKYPKSKGIKIIVEGIEEMEDLEQAILLGADYVQGYVLGRPEYDFQDISADLKNEILEIRRKLFENTSGAE